MLPDTLKYAAIMLAAGIGIPVLAGLNASLGIRLGNPAAAATCLFGVAFLATFIVFSLTGFAGFFGIPTAPKHLFLASLLVAFYVLSITWIAPKFGVGNAVFFVLLSQIIAATLIDHFGLFGARQAALSYMRTGGISLMLMGIFLVQKAP
ncbi:MAG: transporter family-2 protein [Paracoccaceae bacterium]|jgi:transporter family-2 protein